LALPFGACAALFPFEACFVLACCGAVTAGHAPTVSPWRMCAGSAFFETMIVTKGCFFECV